MTDKEVLEAVFKENRELHRKFGMIEHKCKSIVKFGFASNGLASYILKILGVEI